MSVYEAKIIQIASIPPTKVAKIQVYAKFSQVLESHTVSSSVISVTKIDVNFSSKIRSIESWAVEA